MPHFGIVPRPYPVFQPFAGGAQAVPDLFTLAASMAAAAPTMANAASTAGGALTVDGKAMGSYEYAIRNGDVNVAAFNAADWFTATANSVASFIAVNGNLTIPAGILFTPSVNKLFTLVYCNTLTVAGELSMSLRGANHSAVGSNIAPVDIALAKATFGGLTNPIIPAAGGAGAPNAPITGGIGQNAFGEGIPGSSATNGAGGGGSGGINEAGVGGFGTAGTCFAGGAGGGGGRNANGGNAGIYGSGGGGGAAAGGGNRSAAGGAGNPPGGGGGPGYLLVPETGVGGTLIIFARNGIAGAGTISARGGAGGDCNLGGSGGGSGGGIIVGMTRSIAGFTGTQNVAGGLRGGERTLGSVSNGSYGGKGGDGSSRLIVGNYT